MFPHGFSSDAPGFQSLISCYNYYTIELLENVDKPYTLNIITHLQTLNNSPVTSTMSNKELNV